MGYMKHDAIMAMTDDWRDIGWENTTALVAAFRETIPEPYRRLLVGPVPAIVNGHDYWCFLPDGSKEGWETSDEAEKWRAAFVALLREHVPSEYAAVSFGGDLEAAIVEDSHTLGEERWDRLWQQKQN